MEVDWSSILVINVRIWLSEDSDSSMFFLGYASFSPSCQFISLIHVSSLSLPTTCLDMAPIRRRPSFPHSAHPSHAAKASIDAVEFYEDYVPEADKSRMIELKEEVHQI
jgi:hypothetical protein